MPTGSSLAAFAAALYGITTTNLVIWPNRSSGMMQPYPILLGAEVS